MGRADAGVGRVDLNVVNNIRTPDLVCPLAVVRFHNGDATGAPVGNGIVGGVDSGVPPCRTCDIVGRCPEFSAFHRSLMGQATGVDPLKPVGAVGKAGWVERILRGMDGKSTP